MIILNPYKLGSRGAKRLKEEIVKEHSIKVVTLTREPKGERSMVINWGNSKFDYDTRNRVTINPPIETRVMANKVNFFTATNHDNLTVQWTKDRSEAKKWGKKVFARTIINGSGGEGIVVWEPDSEIELVPAPLYTLYQPKTHEYRVHMARSLNGATFGCILAQRKLFRKTPEMTSPPDWNIRNHKNGFIFSEEPVTKVPEKVIEAAETIMKRYFKYMHFAALDIIYLQKSDKAFVIEGNTAPGLENNTVKIYASYFAGLHADMQRERTTLLNHI